MKKLATIAIMALFLMYSCQDDSKDMLDSIESEFNIEEARNWYETNNNPIIVMNSARPVGSKSNLNVKPKPALLQVDWKHAFKSKRDHIEVVETHLKSESFAGYATENSRKKWKESDNEKYLLSLSRLLVIKNTKDNTVNGYIMTIIGESNYLEKKKFQLWDNTYLKKNKGFTGNILFKTLKGEFVNGWKMSDGKVLARITRKKTEENARNLTGGCVTFGLYEYFQECDYGYSHTVGEYYPIAGSCTISSELLSSWEECSTSGGGTNPDVDPTPGENVENSPPDCSIFTYERVGATNWQCAAVDHVSQVFVKFDWDCVGIGVNIVNQPLYFQLPINSTFPPNSGTTQVQSAGILHDAFKAFDSWMGNNACGATSEAQRYAKFIELIKEEFEEYGGRVTLTPPLGYLGASTRYKSNYMGYGDCL